MHIRRHRHRDRHTRSLAALALWHGAADRKVYYGRTWAPPAMETQPDTDHAMETTAAVDGDVGVEQEVDVLSVSA